MRLEIITMKLFGDIYQWQFHNDIDCPLGGDGNSQFQFFFNVLGFTDSDSGHQSSTRDVLSQPWGTQIMYNVKCMELIFALKYNSLFNDRVPGCIGSDNSRDLHPFHLQTGCRACTKETSLSLQDGGKFLALCSPGNLSLISQKIKMLKYLHQSLKMTLKP